MTGDNGMAESSGWALSRSFWKLQLIGCLLAVRVGEGQGHEGALALEELASRVHACPQIRQGQSCKLLGLSEF